jgi:hypothetical protein
MKHEALTRQLIGLFYDVYNELGHGFLESVYQKSYTLALQQAGLRIEQQFPVKVSFRGLEVVTQPPKTVPAYNVSSPKLRGVRLERQTA